MSRNGKAPAFTLIETLIVVALFSTLLVAMWVLYDIGFRLFSQEEIRAGARMEPVRALSILSRELRQAVSVTGAEASSLTFSADTDRDGADESIQYRWQGTAGQDLERISGATIPVVQSVQSLSFAYYDASNNLLNFPVTPSQARLVQADLTVLDRDETFHIRTRMDLRSV